MKKFGFYVTGLKGYRCLLAFINEFGYQCISFVISARDERIEDDCYERIEDLCATKQINFGNRSESVDKSDAFMRFAIGWRWIIPSQSNLIVFHDSLLPRYRGFAPLVNALINGDKEIGVTALMAETQYDCGDIVDQKSISIEYPKKIIEAIEDVSHLYVDVMLGIARRVIAGVELVAAKQDHSKSSYSPWRDEHDYVIDWRRSAEYISRLIDAVGYPYKGAMSLMRDKQIRIHEAQIVPDVTVEDRLAHVGKVLFMSDGRPTVICGEGLLQLRELVDVGGDSLIGKIPFRARFGGGLDYSI